MYGLTPFSRDSFDLFNLFNDFDRSFFSGGSSVSCCRTDIRDAGDRYVMESELPGFSKEDISLDIKGSYLTVSAEKKSENEQRDSDGKYIRRERCSGSYKRSFDISDVNCDAISAEYKNGVLEVELPKKRHETPETKRLEIK